MSEKCTFNGRNVASEEWVSLMFVSDSAHASATRSFAQNKSLACQPANTTSRSGVFLEPKDTRVDLRDEQIHQFHQRYAQCAVRQSDVDLAQALQQHRR